MKNKVNILWTGGWDSTYRMIELSRKELDVNPIYIYMIQQDQVYKTSLKQ